MGRPVVICPYRFLEDSRIFRDAISLLSGHTPGNTLHVVPEVPVPGGSIDYFIASVDDTTIVDYLGLEIQTLDTTGTVWPARQKLIRDLLEGDQEDLERDDRSYGMNWRMTAKTILMQLHHKAATMEHLGKKLVLVIQDAFYDYIAQEFSTASLRTPDAADPIHFHVYDLAQGYDGVFTMNLIKQESTTTVGMAQMLAMSRDAQVSPEQILTLIQARINGKTLLI